VLVGFARLTAHCGSKKFLLADLYLLLLSGVPFFSMVCYFITIMARVKMMNNIVWAREKVA